jgi:tetratricopeptide (TPR) repeat protein
MSKLLNSPLFAALLILLTASAGERVVSGAPPLDAERTTPLPRLGDHHFKVTTASADAQRAFDRGLTLAYSFLHYPAEQEFRRATTLDPDCAMAWWGIALVNGPHINHPIVPPKKAAAAWDALTKAQAVAAKASPVEQALIRALSKRYANPQPEDRGPLDIAYSNAMRELWRANPENADIGTLFVEAAMDLHPWDLWKAGKPQPWTSEIVSTLERVLVINPNHPGANHLYIHAMEASANPEKAVAAADRLGKLVPDASHMLHMPAHIYARVGRWEDAADSNRRAMQADVQYRAAFPRPGFYAMYMAHNAHFLGFVSMMQGRSKDAIQIARDLVASVPPDFLKDYAGIADGYMIFVSHALMRFGRWDEILAEPEPPAERPLSRALWRFTRTSALIALNRLAEARAERDAFAKAVAAVPEGYTFGNNTAANLLAIAAHVLDGEMAARTGDLDTAVRSLRAGARIEDELLYDEPPDWIQPVRHTLGAVLLRAGKPGEAEQVYREDLDRYPENGWSLFGLRDALKAQGKQAEADRVSARFEKAWARADVTPSATCYCQAYR